MIKSDVREVHQRSKRVDVPMLPIILFQGTHGAQQHPSGMLAPEEAEHHHVPQFMSAMGVPVSRSALRKPVGQDEITAFGKTRAASFGAPTILRPGEPTPAEVDCMKEGKSNGYITAQEVLADAGKDKGSPAQTNEDEMGGTPKACELSHQLSTPAEGQGIGPDGLPVAAESPGMKSYASRSFKTSEVQAEPLVSPEGGHEVAMAFNEGGIKLEDSFNEPFRKSFRKPLGNTAMPAELSVSPALASAV